MEIMRIERVTYFLWLVTYFSKAFYRLLGFCFVDVYVFFFFLKNGK